MDLQPHPDSPAPPDLRLTVEVRRPRPQGLWLAFRLDGDLAQLRLPPLGAPARTGGLWEHSCFEAFVAGDEAGEGPAYREINLAPSSLWAAYDFDDYRTGMRDAPLEILRFDRRADEAGLEIVADLDLPDPPRGRLRLGLAAVLEHADGRRSYWALSRPPGKPDFHHPDSFTLEPPLVETA